MSNAYLIFFFIRAIFISVAIGMVIHFCVVLRGVGVSLLLRVGICIAAILLTLAFFFVRVTEGSSFWLTAMAFIGTSWSAFMFHALLLWMLTGVLWLLNRAFRLLVVPAENRARWRYRWGMGIIGLAFLACVAGGINAQFPLVREGKITAPEWVAPLRMVVLSDLHIGRLASVDYLAKLVDKIEPLAPDIVFFLGDILEYDLDHSEAAALAAVMQRLQPRLGIWGAMGNHEYMGDLEKNEQLLQRMGVNMLIDRWVELDVSEGEGQGGKILLIGRDDKHVGRLPLQRVIENAPAGVPKILLDHSPVKLEEAEKAGVFLQLSGHTHNGQFFPLNFALALFFENSHGYSRRGDTHYWVSSGAGTWGARIRTSGRPEIVMIDLVGSEDR